jgi:hypothetical protein
MLIRTGVLQTQVVPDFLSLPIVFFAAPAPAVESFSGKPVSSVMPSKAKHPGYE